MATTTFNGTVRSDGDIKVSTKSSTLGTFTDYATMKAAGGMEIEKVAATGTNIVAAGTSTVDTWSISAFRPGLCKKFSSK